MTSVVEGEASGRARRRTIADALPTLIESPAERPTRLPEIRFSATGSVRAPAPCPPVSATNVPFELEGRADVDVALRIAADDEARAGDERVDPHGVAGEDRELEIVRRHDLSRYHLGARVRLSPGYPL